MFKYEGRNPETLKVKTMVFVSKEEAEDFAIKVNEEYPNYKIAPVLIDGIVAEDDDENEYNERDELKMMGLNTEETSEGYDWAEDKSDD
jgi:hypothetical protein